MKKSVLVIIVFAICFAYGQEGQKTQPTVSITGEGIVTVIPDQVVVSVRVEHKGKSALEVKERNDNTIDAVLKFCEKLKIDKKDINTTRINLNKNYDYQKKTYNYIANQSLKIHLKDLNKYEELIQGLLNSGINRIDGVAFKSSKMEMHEREARIKAVKNAKEKAVLYTGVLDQGIGKALSISENRFNAPVQQPYEQKLYRSASIESNTQNTSQTIAIGELKVKIQLQLIFELK